MTDCHDSCRRMEAFRSANPWVEQSALFSVLTEQPDLAGKVRARSTSLMPWC